MTKHLYRPLFFTLLIIFLFSFSFCKKNVPGPQGDPGEPGKKGNVKQTHISSFTQPASAWTFDGTVYRSVIYAPDISDNVVNTGEVRAYMLVDGQWWNLPYAVGDIFMRPAFAEGQVLLTYSKIHNGPPPKPGALNFRVVILSPVQ